MENSEITEQYKESCSIIYKTTLNGDYKTGNKEGKKEISKSF